MRRPKLFKFLGHCYIGLMTTEIVMPPDVPDCSGHRHLAEFSGANKCGSPPILFPQPCRGQMIFSESTDLQDLPRNPGIEVSSRNLEPMAKTMRNPRKAEARRGPRSAGRRPLTWMRNPGRDWKPQMVKEEYEELTLLTCHIYAT